jgi:thiol-disulfide isomerase/thioredoxin
MLPCAPPEPVRPPVDTIPAPPFPRHLPWVNVAPLRMDKQIGRPVLVEFWDFCRPSSLRTLPYMRGWYERYSGHGLRVIGVHCPGFSPSHDEDAVRAAVARLGIDYPVCIDTHFELWQLYDNPGWPARYLFDKHGMLHEYHHGEGGYQETEHAIQELLGITADVMRPVRPEEDPAALIAVPTADQEGAWSGPYEAGGVWAVLDGCGRVVANGRELPVEAPGCYPLIEHERHTAGVLDLQVGAGVTCHAVCFTPGLAMP